MMWLTVRRLLSGCTECRMEALCPLCLRYSYGSGSAAASVSAVGAAASAAANERVEQWRMCRTFNSADVGDALRAAAQQRSHWVCALHPLLDMDPRDLTFCYRDSHSHDRRDGRRDGPLFDVLSAVPELSACRRFDCSAIGMGQRRRIASSTSAGVVCAPLPRAFADADAPIAADASSLPVMAAIKMFAFDPHRFHSTIERYRSELIAHE